MATPGDLYGWFPPTQQLPTDEKRWNIPERMPNALTGDTQGMLGFTGQPLMPMSQMAYDLAGSPRQLPPTIGASLGSGLSGSAMPGGGSNGDPTENGKFQGAASGAAAGSSFGPYGALIGGIIGYGASGGAKDLNPIDASGFTGVGMEQAWKDQNLARLGSNPAAAVASKLENTALNPAHGLGLNPDSLLGKMVNPMSALDPTSFFSGLFRSKKGDEKRNISAFLKEYPVTDAGNGMYQLQDGMKISSDQLQHLAGTWYGATYAPDGNQADWQDKYNEALQEIYSQPMYFGG